MMVNYAIDQVYFQLHYSVHSLGGEPDTYSVDSHSDTASISSSGSTASDYLNQEKRSYEFYQKPSTSRDKENSSDVSRGHRSQTRGHTSGSSKTYTPTMVDRLVSLQTKHIMLFKSVF